MKSTLTLIFLMLLFSQNSLAQKDSASNSFRKGTPEYYNHESKTILKAGLIIAGTGVALTTAGLIIFNSDIDYSSEKAFFSTGAMLQIIGGLTTLASIPCFILHFIQKNRARVLLKEQSVSFTTSKNMITQPSISIQISL